MNGRELLASAVAIYPRPSGRLPVGVSGLGESVAPADRWNVRNFGWGPAPEGMRATATRRTLNETAEVVEFINRNVLLAGGVKAADVE
jgi:hypothetical protein